MKTKFKQTEIGKIPEEWDVKEFQEVGQINMGQSPKSATYNNIGEGLPFYQGRKDFGRKYPTVSIYCTDPKKIARKGDVLLTVRAPVGDVNVATEKCCIGRGVSALRLNNGNNDFLYYLMRYFESKWRNLETGTTFGAIKKDDLRFLKILFPLDEEQRRIASILTAFDDKIELNEQMNRTLEEMASVIFKSWFVDFEPFQDGEFEYNEKLEKEVPKGWEVVSLDTIADFKNGKGLKASKRDINGLYPIMGSNGEIGRTNAVLYNEPVITIGRVGACGEIHYSFTPCWVSDNAIAVTPKEKNDFYFLYIHLKRIDYLSFVSGSANPLITQTAVKSQKIILPRRDDLDRFSEIIKPLFEKICRNKIENQTLVQIRDTLLPKLLSGEMRVNHTKKLEVDR